MCVCVCVCAHSCSTLRCQGLYSPPGSSVHGIFQARILEWGATFWGLPQINGLPQIGAAPREYAVFPLWSHPYPKVNCTKLHVT